MKLLQELSTLKEGRVKEALMDVIANAVNHAPIGKASYPLALRIIAKFARENDPENILSGCSDKELKEYIADEFSEADHSSINEGEEKPEFPKVIAKADEFRVELDEKDDVAILDGEEKIRLTMPLVVWKSLIRQ